MKWGVGLPVVLLTLVALGLAARYLPRKYRLDRLKQVEAVASFEPRVPASIRNELGDERCRPLDRIASIQIPVKSEQDLQEIAGLNEVKAVQILGAADWTITSKSLAPLSSLPLLEKCVIGIKKPEVIFAMIPVGDGGFACAQSSSGPDPVVQLQPNALSVLKHAPRLTALEIKDIKLEEGWSRQLTELSHLTELNVVAPVTVSDLQAIVALKSLRRVSWQCPGTRDESLSAFSVDPTAASWTLKLKEQELTTSLLEPLSNVLNLQSLELWCQTLDPDVLSPLKRCSKLRFVTVQCTRVAAGDSPLDWGPSPAFLSIFFDSYEHHGLNLRNLERLPMLTALNLNSNEISLEDYQALSKLTQLRALRFPLYCSKFNAGFEQLAQLANLEELDFGETDWNSTALEIISSMPKLRWLRWSADPNAIRDLQIVPPALAEHIKSAIADGDLYKRPTENEPPLGIGTRSLLLTPEIVLAP